MPFATLVTSTSITGYLVAIPLIICLVGIGLNGFLRFSNKIQINKIKKSLKNPTMLAGASSFFQDYFKASATEDDSTLYDVFNKYAPILMIIAWSLCLVFTILQITIGII